jgi:hypothetical protein
MKPNQESEADRLYNYLNPEEIETAPEGFTDKLMKQISKEPASVNSTARHERSFVPYISAGITAIFVLTAIFLPPTESHLIAFQWTGKLDRIRSILPESNFIWSYSISLPEIMAYVTLSIFLLLIFDRTLFRYFHQET